MQGVILGAVPVLISSALGLWATVRTSRANFIEAQLTIAADQARWLRSQRSDLYIEMVRMLRVARRHRVSKIKDVPLLEAADAVNSPDGAAAVEAMYSRDRPEVLDISVRGTALCPPELGAAFDAALKANVFAWKQYAESVRSVAVRYASSNEAPTSGEIIFSHSVQEAMENAIEKENAVFHLIHADQLWTDDLKVLRRIGRLDR